MDPLIGEIRAFATKNIPPDWLVCDGSQLPIRQFSGLYDVIQCYYGGDFEETFLLPDLRGRVAVGQHPSQIDSGGPYTLGVWGGQSQVLLTAEQVAPHDHPFNAAGAQDVPTMETATQLPAEGSYFANLLFTNGQNYEPLFGFGNGSETPTIALSENAIPPFGYPIQSHDNHQPYLVVNYCIYAGPASNPSTTT